MRGGSRREIWVVGDGVACQQLSTVWGLHIGVGNIWIKNSVEKGTLEITLEIDLEITLEITFENTQRSLRDF